MSTRRPWVEHPLAIRDNSLPGCPFCGCRLLYDDGMTSGHPPDTISRDFVSCDECGAQGPLAEDPDAARRRWSERFTKAGEVDRGA